MNDAPDFLHGVASFEPTDRGVLLWTRLGGLGESVASTEWMIAADPRLHDVVRSGSATTGPDQDHTVTVEVDGLEPATSYWYRFRSGSVESPVGRTRTLPGPGVERFVLATVCCARFTVAPLGVYRALAESEVDLVLHLGDYIYEDDGSGGPRGHDPSHVATSLDDYRRRIAQIRADPDARALHQRHPVVTIWDDHDFSDNAWHDGAKKHDPEQHGPWPARVSAAAQARQEWLPARLRDPADPLLTWRSMLIGDLAELVLLDTRFTGRDRQAGDEGSPDLHDPDRSLLGDAQRAWVGDRLRDVERPWAILASGVVVNELVLRWPRPFMWVNALLPNGYAVLDGRLVHDDQWDGYPAERARLVEALADRGRQGGRSVILSGDVHSSWAFCGPIDAATGDPVAVEMTTPAVSSAAMGRAHYPGFWRVLDREANRLEHVRWADVTERGYGLLDLTPSAAVAHWWFVDPYADDPAGDAVLAASFRTDHRGWPPTFDAVEVSFGTPGRVGLPDPLPPRPADLGRLRARRRARLVVETTAWALAAVSARLRPWRSRWSAEGSVDSALLVEAPGDADACPPRTWWTRSTESPRIGRSLSRVVTAGWQGLASMPLGRLTLAMDLDERRAQLQAHGLAESEVDAEPGVQFERWFTEAVEAGMREPEAMIVSTATAGGIPSSRHVLVRDWADGSLTFFTNYESQKGRELAVNPMIAACFPWNVLGRQVRVAGRAERTSAEVSDAYFATRARDSQIGAWASAQSSVLTGRGELEARVAEVEERFAGIDVSRPPHWGGYRILPVEWEFWQGRPSRLHDRIRYRIGDDPTGGWIIERLSP